MAESRDKMQSPVDTPALSGKSQASAIDFYSKIETNFLEKYFKYVLLDELGDYFSDEVVSRARGEPASKHESVNYVFMAIRDIPFYN